ncbi:27kDa outer membrane protein [Rhodobacterales bacterium Y4I]|nr:27kDa outer membrane protein [Rhodobacterales bacterium Y4I]
MTRTKTIVLWASLSAMPLIAQANERSADEIKALVYEAILERPEIILQAVEQLQQAEEAEQAALARAALTESRNNLFNDPNAPVLGNPEGDVTVVEFFDYNCPYCRRAMAEVQGLLDADQNVRLVYREWPILGEGSDFAARAALAARQQGKYEALHWALMGMSGKANEISVLRIAREVGLDIDQLKRDMDAPEVAAHIAQSMALAQKLGFNGTPSFVIEDALVPGFVEQSQLQSVVDSARGAASD